ncbi:MAG: AIR carboxylase family protein, partial [Victivallales bacterium]|nr:AIR carboxylase family protein [Victivallales bacterium]
MTAKVGLLMGSNSDLPKIQGCLDTLKALGVETEVHVMSAHRTPDLVADYAANAASRG